MPHLPFDIIHNFSLLKFHYIWLLFAAGYRCHSFLSVHRVDKIEGLCVIEGDKCAFGYLVLFFQNFDLIGDICIILHCRDELASLFVEFDHLALVAVVLDHHNLVLLFLQLYLIFEFVFDLLIDLLL